MVGLPNQMRLSPYRIALMPNQKSRVVLWAPFCADPDGLEASRASNAFGR